jgi:ribosomal protein S18 acetylase RimI-like enzyme
MQFIKVQIEDFDEAYSCIEESFPLCERRTYQEAKAVLQSKEYTLFHIEESGKKIGLLGVWLLDGFCFIEHFAIYPCFRNNGFGAKALTLAKSKWKTLVLEVEPDTTEIAKRRLNFYKRNGFLQNEFEYKLPSYRLGEEDVELVILSYPTLLSQNERVIKEIYKKVYGR